MVSQNEQQAQSNPALYSYTLYDALGRITEVGQKPQSEPMKPAISRLPNQAARLAGTVPTTTTISLDEWLNSTANNQTKEQITRTVYDLPYVNSALCPLLCQQNLRNRVSYVQVFDVDPASLPATTPDKHQAATYYTYDISGNVTELLQDINQGPMASTGNRFKKLTYSFDLISGKVNEVAYQAGQPDEFYHRYLYDAENKITEVFTSSDYIKWDNDASYTYYKHGPLARTILGQQRVQGIDYAYTLQGWLKGVNSSSVITDGTTGQSINAGKFDMGKDGYYNSTNSNRFIARDVYSYQLNYFDGDYTPIGGQNPFVKTGVHSLPATNGTTTQTVAKELYNGNIASMFVNIPKIGDAQLYGYQYDQLNRLVGMDAYNNFSNHKNNWTGSTPTNLPSSGYQERISYDANGNILTYLRNGALGASGIAMDNMSYQYPKAADGNLLSNQLRYVHDAASTSAYTTDIKNNAHIGINSKDDIDAEKLAVNQPGDNYQYDKIGNLIADKKEDIINIEWTVYGKISPITKSNSSIQYTYDASGNRISKAVTTGGQTNYTYYVRDASGNVMSVYEKNSTLNGNLLTQSEVHLYGSSRLGVININRQAEVFTPGPNDEFDMGYFARGKKLYELTNHLGNVLVTISDKKIAGITGTLVPGVRNNPITHYMAEVVTANDYYPGGMIMPGRKYEQPNSNYRYGFNGQEKSNDVIESNYTAEFWEYDSRIGRRWNIDPVYKHSPYEVFGSNPLMYNDKAGLDTVKISGINNSSLTFFSKELRGGSFSSTLDFNGNHFFNLPYTPDAIGYSIEASLNGTAGPLQGSLKGSASSFAIFTRGAYSWQPFRYGYGGASGGAGGSTASGAAGLDGNATVSVSPFVAWFTTSELGFAPADENGINPESWQYGFMNSNASVSFQEGIGGSIGATYFRGLPWSYEPKPGFGWWGASLDIGLSGGAGISAGVQNGATYYKLMEKFPTPTQSLPLNRLMLKWAECMSGGSFPGTVLSDFSHQITPWINKQGEKIRDGFNNDVNQVRGYWNEMIRQITQFRF